MVAARRAGATVEEIASKERLARATVTSALSRLRSRGVDVPRQTNHAFVNKTWARMKRTKGVGA